MTIKQEIANINKQSEQIRKETADYIKRMKALEAEAEMKRIATEKRFKMKAAKRKLKEQSRRVPRLKSL